MQRAFEPGVTTKPPGRSAAASGSRSSGAPPPRWAATVTVRNEDGAVFTVTLPHAAQPALTRMTVRTLIVDDDVRVADIHKSYVEKVDGFEVAGIANRGTEALRRVLDDQPDLVLLDIYLPDLGGLEVCRRLRAAGNLVDVIAVTAARDVETVRAATGLGIAQYLVKPFAFATFREKLERYTAYRARAARGGEAGQDEIDAMLGELRSSTAIPLPKGLSRETLDLVARTLA